MAVDEKWYFTKEQLLQSPSRKAGYDVDKELSCRQQAANFIQDMGQRLQVSQLCINTAIVYMHRFYVFHSLAAFHRNAIAAAALFLAAKVEEQPRKLEHVIKVAHMCLHRENPNLDTKSELYLEQAQDLVFNENVLLQTLGFDVAIDHPHTHVVRCCHLVRASKDLAQTSYFMASNSLHLTTMCLQYKPTVVACFCIHLACKWSNWEIPRSNEGKDWFWYIDKTVTIDLLEQLTGEFLAILDKCPTKLKRKMMSMNQNNTPGFTQQSIPHDGLQFEEPRKLSGAEAIKVEGLFTVQKSNSQSAGDKPGTSASSASSQSHTHHQKIDYREYREKKERERMEREKQQLRDGHSVSSTNHHHHSKGNVMSIKSHSNVQSRSSSGSVSHKSYQQPPQGVQQNMHFQNVKESRDSSSQGFQSSSAGKDSNYLKQHPPHMERDGGKDSAPFHGQFSQNSNLQHQGYPHKSESNYSGNYSHRDGSRGGHGIQGSGSSNLSQAHHSQNQNVISNSTNSVNCQRESMTGSQRDGVIPKESESQSQQPQMKDTMSSSIRDIINQSVSQKDVHSMTNERKEHVRDKSRMNYMHGSTSGSNFKPESVKTGRESGGMNFHELSDRKMEDITSRLKEKPFKKGEEEPVIDTVKIESTPVKPEKFDETDLGDENASWSFGMNMPNIKPDKSNTPVTVKMESNAGKNELIIEAIKGDAYSNSDPTVSHKSQSGHSMKMYDSKYKGHHYHSSSKNSDIPQIKIDKPGAQCLNSDLYKKLSDRAHDKQRKPQELERGSLVIEGSSNLGDMSKHHKLNKEASDKHKILMPGQHNDQRTKEKLSPSKYQKVKAVPRPPNLPYVKSEPGHYSLDPNSNSNTIDGERLEGTNQHLMSLKPIGAEEPNKNVSNVSGFQKQKNHEFGAPGNLTTTLTDTNFVKSSKTSSIFSPDSKIPPQNILNSLEKDSKKNSLSTQRSHSSNKTSPSSILTGSKKTASAAILGTMTTSTTSTTGSLFSPPLPKNVPSVAPRHRTSSSGSEPELIPVVSKVEETGYENLIRDKKASLISNDSSPSVDREKKSLGSSEKLESTNAFLFDFDHKVNAKDIKSNDVKTNAVSSEPNQSVTSKPLTNVKFPTEIRSDLGAVIYPTNPKSTPVSKSGQGFTTVDSKLSIPKSTSTVNLSGIEKMVDTSISPSKQVNQFIGQVVKSSGAPNSNLNPPVSFVNTFGSSNSSSIMDQPDKSVVDQSSLKAGNAVPNSDVDVDVLGYSEKKRSEKKKKKEKHKHKEKDKDKSERKKEKKKHKDKDKERSKEKDKHKEKEKYKDRERYKEKEIDVVSSETPIKITIPKDKISGSLKIRIPKDYLRKEEPDTLKSNTSGELKIKISKDNCSNSGTYKEDLKSESRKRERSPKSSSDLPHTKSMRTLDKKSSGSVLKANGTEGSSRNSSSQKYSVSENGSYFDISSLYDFPFDFEENGQGIIKTPDYDFEALNASEYPQDFNTSPELKEIEECDKNSHNELELTKDEVCVVTSELETSAISPKAPVCCDLVVTCGDITTESIPKPISPLNDIDSPERLRFSEGVSTPPKTISETPWSLNEDRSDVIKRDTNLAETKSDDVRKDKMISLENCDVLKNYKTILDSHSRRCETEVLKHNVSPVSPEESTTETATTTTTTTTTTTCTVNSNNDDNNNKKSNTSDIVTNTDKNTVKGANNTCETENPNYYNKYFKKDGGSRIRSRDDKRSVKSRVDDKGSRFDDRQRYYDNRRYNRTDFSERDRRDDRRYYRDYRDYSKESSQYYYERNDERRFDYPDYSSNNQYFNGSKVEGNVSNLTYEVSTNGTSTVFQSVPPQSKTTPQFSQLCDPSIASNPPEMNVQYQYSYFNNYMYAANGAYRFYGNVPFVNMSYVQQQPIPPGTGDSFIQLDAPPLPLEPPPDLPPPPETPPPPPK